jgi:hypothetical protein
VERVVRLIQQAELVMVERVERLDLLREVVGLSNYREQLMGLVVMAVD